MTSLTLRTAPSGFAGVSSSRPRQQPLVPPLSPVTGLGEVGSHQDFILPWLMPIPRVNPTEIGESSCVRSNQHSLTLRAVLAVPLPVFTDFTVF